MERRPHCVTDDLDTDLFIGQGDLKVTAADRFGTTPRQWVHVHPAVVTMTGDVLHNNNQPSNEVRSGQAVRSGQFSL